MKDARDMLDWVLSFIGRDAYVSERTHFSQSDKGTTVTFPDGSKCLLTCTFISGPTKK